ncbi:DUF554 domain-containing protein [Proteocatella sphenisci]|uniref:DUF554 domain-containing protein n=1 Tax=Proteocatella sphenisci TaxID=181070 RepID=UPI00048BBEB0|nr:DUF554 domain-containing protein [Proteocatella sphenisci]
MLTGTIVNTIAIIAGALIGVIAKKAIPQRVGDLIMSAIPIVVMVLGVQFAMASSNILIVIVSLVIGGIIGEWIDIDKKLDDFGTKIQSRIKGKDANFSVAFVSTTLIYCVGSMAILGSIESGINNNHTILYTKALMDGISAIFFASTLGTGVIFSGISVFIYQGILTVLAGYVSPYLSPAVVTEMSASGGILLIALAFTILGIKKIKVANLLPAIFLPIILMFFIR